MSIKRSLSLSHWSAQQEKKEDELHMEQKEIIKCNTSKPLLLKKQF